MVRVSPEGHVLRVLCVPILEAQRWPWLCAPPPTPPSCLHSEKGAGGEQASQGRQEAAVKCRA